jgi:8-oxo-dGTP pyrophosphatase MutT (NUDIX family)
VTENLTASAPDGASVILYTADQVLLYKRDGRPKIFPHRWAIFGGGIEEGETPEETVCRELRDELGYSLLPQDLEYLGRFGVHLGLYNYTVHYYRAQLKQDFWDILLALSKVKHLEREGAGIALFSHEEVDYLNLVCHDRVALERHFHGRDFGFVD